MWSYVATAALSASLAFGAGIQWQQGVQARADLETADLRANDARLQRLASDKAAATHAAALATINNKLGIAREQIAKLSGRECLDAGTVGVLNAIGDQPVRAAASDSESAAAAATPASGIRFATDGDAADAIATCRARYAEVSSQVNQILNIEDRRNPP